MAVSGGSVTRSLDFGEDTFLVSLIFSYSIGVDPTGYRPKSWHYDQLDDCGHYQAETEIQSPQSSYIFRDVSPINVLVTK